MTVSRICLASWTDHENFLLMKKIEVLQSVFENLEFISAQPSRIAEAVDPQTVVVILNIMEWRPREYAQLRQLKAQMYTGGVIALAKVRPDLKTVRAIGLENFLVVEKPFGTNELLGVVRKMLLAKAVGQQSHRRFYTDQVVEIESVERPGRFNSRLSNISKGGARIEVNAAAPLKVGDLVKMHVALTEVSRLYIMPAKVVWADASSEERKIGLGLEFIGPGQVRSLEAGA